MSDNEENGGHGEDVEFVYSIPMPKLPESIRPLDCVVLLSGIDMESGAPTITAMGSEGMTPWLALGMMQIESHRLSMGYTLTAVALNDDDDEEY